MSTQVTRFLLLLSIAALSLFSCTQELELDPIPERDNPEAYSEYHFKVMGESLAKAFEQDGFKENFYGEVAKKFDGETSVLFKSLFQLNNFPQDGKTLNSIEAFYNIEEESFYPHVYVPNYETLKGKADQLSNPYVVLFVPGFGDAKEEHQVFQIQGGALVEQNFKIKEEFLEENLTLVISLNESVDNEGNLPEKYVEETGESRTKTLETIDYFFDDMTILERKESGFSGKSEVAIRGWGRFTNDPNANVALPISRMSSSGHLIRDFTRSEVENATTVNVNYLIDNFWQVEKYARSNRTEPYHISYVIFERDPWPAQHRTALVDVCGTPSYLGFRSSDSSYLFEAIFGYSDASCSTTNYWRGHAEDFHPEIRFTTKYVVL